MIVFESVEDHVPGTYEDEKHEGEIEKHVLRKNNNI